jgi:hypothetical protein
VHSVSCRNTLKQVEKDSIRDSTQSTMIHSDRMINKIVTKKINKITVVELIVQVLIVNKISAF